MSEEQTKQTGLTDMVLCAKGLTENNKQTEIELFQEGCDYQFGIIIKICGDPFKYGTCPYIRRGFTYNGTSYYPCSRDTPRPKTQKRLE